MNRKQAEKIVDKKMKEMDETGGLEGCRDQGDLREAMIKSTMGTLYEHPPVWKVDIDNGDIVTYYFYGQNKTEVKRKLKDLLTEHGTDESMVSIWPQLEVKIERIQIEG